MVFIAIFLAATTADRHDHKARSGVCANVRNGNQWRAKKSSEQIAAGWHADTGDSAEGPAANAAGAPDENPVRPSRPEAAGVAWRRGDATRVNLARRLQGRLIWINRKGRPRARPRRGAAATPGLCVRARVRRNDRD